MTPCRLGALLLVVVVAGCGGGRGSRLDRADGLLPSRSQGVVPVSREAPGADRALLGLAWDALAPDNPARDERRAAAYLDQLVTEYPKSPWATDGRILRDLLATIGGLRQEVERLRRDVRYEQQEARRVRDDLERLRQVELELERTLGKRPAAGLPIGMGP
jgi:hypothetical protein